MLFKAVLFINKGADVQLVEKDLNQQVNNILSNCERLDILVNKVVYEQFKYNSMVSVEFDYHR